MFFSVFRIRSCAVQLYQTQNNKKKDGLTAMRDLA
jgi:hypothetical protein